MITLLSMILVIIVGLVLIFQSASLFVSTACLGVAMLLITIFHGMADFFLLVFWILWAVVAALNSKSLRYNLSKRVLKFYQKVMPEMSKTEREALNAGSVAWDGELFSGNPNWSDMQKLKKPGLSTEEQDFIDGPVTQLCRMINDWEITQKQKALSPAVWDFIRENGFFGLIIPKSYGGKGFSTQAHSEVLMKLFSCSITAACTVAVPNSLGPAELLLHYGTDEQKNHYLPRLAKGEEVPCFALTSPRAGSDATAMPDYGVVCEEMFNGQKTLGMRVTWNKRYITLCPVATVLGLAFKLYDPDRLIGDTDYLGITCALIPTSHEGVVTGRRHHPASAVFQNGPTQGENVFIPMEWIIGGQKNVGKGWKMLVECLSVGRSVSLPTSGVAGTKMSALIAGSYARVRRQFNVAIGRFGGIEEKLAEIAAYAYQADAVSQFTLACIDEGVVPAVPSAILKYHCTELSRKATNNAMDILAGKAVCWGPSNPLALGYGGVPIAITVEGANILTRNMIIFGQGSIRCHPFVLKELEAAQMNDAKAALKAFDQALWGHVGFGLSNVARSIIHGFTGARFAKVPNSRAKQYYQQFSRMSSVFALLADACMAIYGGGLKRKERVSARLGDMLSYLYIGSAVLKRFHDQGEPDAEFPLVNWCCDDLLFQLQTAAVAVIRGLPDKVAATSLRLICFPWGQTYKPPRDRVGHQLAQILMETSEVRDRLLRGICRDPKAHNQADLFDRAMQAAIVIEPIEKKVRDARKAETVQAYHFDMVVVEAHKQGIISDKEYQQWQEADKLRMAVVNVDDFEKNLLDQ